MKNQKFLNPENKWYLRWRHWAAYTFVLIEIFDFIIMPIVFECINRIDLDQAVLLATKFHDAATQTAALQLLITKRTWSPMTLGGNGIFYIAFGAILGAAAWTRGAERIAMTRTNINNGYSDNDDDCDNNHKYYHRNYNKDSDDGSNTTPDDPDKN